MYMGPKGSARARSVPKSRTGPGSEPMKSNVWASGNSRTPRARITHYNGHTSSEKSCIWDLKALPEPVLQLLEGIWGSLTTHFWTEFWTNVGLKEHHQLFKLIECPKATSLLLKFWTGLTTTPMRCCQPCPKLIASLRVTWGVDPTRFVLQISNNTSKNSVE